MRSFLLALFVLAPPLAAEAQDFRYIPTDNSIAVALDLDSVARVASRRTFSIIATAKGVAPSPGHILVEHDLDCSTSTILTVAITGFRGGGEGQRLAHDTEAAPLIQDPGFLALGRLLCEGEPPPELKFQSVESFLEWASRQGSVD